MKQLTVLLILLGAAVGLYMLLGQGEEAARVGAGDGADTVTDDSGEGAHLVGSGAGELLASAEGVAGGCTIRVRVVDPECAPHAGVKVVLRRSNQRDEPTQQPVTPVGYLARSFHWEPDTWEPVGEAISDAEGRVRFERLDARAEYRAHAVPAPPLYPNHVWVAGGRHTAGFRVPTKGEQEIVIGKGAPLRVRVVDAQGNGLQARVSFDGPIRTRDGERYWSQQMLQTDADGRYAFGAVPLGSLEASAFVPGRAGFGPVLIESPVKGEVLLQVDSSDGAAVHGVVRDLSGSGVAGAMILLGVASKNSGGSTHATRLVRTDDQGRYRAEGLPAGRIDNISVGAKDHLLRRGLGREFELAPRQELEIDIVLPRASYIVGTVSDEAGAPIEGVRVQASAKLDGGSSQAFEILPAYSDASGRFRLVTLPPGTGTVTARKQGYMAVPSATPGPLQYVIEEPGQTLQVSIVMRRGMPVTGVVLDEAGAPLPGAEVVAGMQQGGDPWALTERVQETAEAEGAFALPGLRRGKSYVLRARGPAGYSDPHSLAVPEEGDIEPVQLTILPGGLLAGRLIVDGGGRTKNRSVGLKLVGGQFQTHATTDADGRFRFEGLPTGTFELTPPQTVFTAAHSRRGEARAVRLEVTLGVGERREDLQLTVLATQEISGLVVDEHGQPYPRLALQITWSRAGHSGSHSVRTDGEGSFTFQHLPEGTYTISARGGAALGTFEAGEQGLRLQLMRTQKASPSTLEVRVTLPDGTPAPSGSGQLRLVQGNGYISGVGFEIQDGRARVNIPKPRKGTRPVLVIFHAGDLFGRDLNVQPATIDPLDLTQPVVEVQLKAGLAIAGQVVDDAGNPIPGLVVTLNRTGPTTGNNPQTTTDAEGRFRIAALQDVPWVVFVQVGSSDFIAEAGQTVRAGDLDVRVELQVGGVIKGEAYGPGGKPLASAQVTWQAEAVPGQQGGGRYANAPTDADGRFTLRGLQPGLFGTLHVFPNTSKPTEAMRTMVERVRVGTVDVRVDLDRGLFIEGTVVLPEGAPAGFLTVFIQGKEPNQQQTTNAQVKEGAFRLGPVPAGEYVLRAMGTGFPAQHPIDVVAPSSGVVVRYRIGVPLSGKLLVDDPQSFIGYFIQHDAKGNVSGTQGIGFQQDGTFRIALPEDVKGLLYVGHNADDRMALLKSVKPSDGPFEIQVTEGRSISGRIEGLPEGVQYTFVQTTGWLVRSTQVGKDGTFRIGGLPPGKYDLMFWSANVRGTRSQVPVGTTDLVLTADEPK